MKDKQDRRMTEFLRYNSVVAHFLVPSSSLIAKAALQVAPLNEGCQVRVPGLPWQGCLLTRSSTLEQEKDVRSIKLHGYSAFTNHF